MPMSNDEYVMFLKTQNKLSFVDDCAGILPEIVELAYPQQPNETPNEFNSRLALIRTQLTRLSLRISDEQLLSADQDKSTTIIMHPSVQAADDYIHAMIDDAVDTIAPCPYCGSDSVECHPNDIARDGHSMAGASSADLHYTHCNGCGAEGPGANSYYEAIELHNRRV